MDGFTLDLLFNYELPDKATQCLMMLINVEWRFCEGLCLCEGLIIGSNLVCVVLPNSNNIVIQTPLTNSRYYFGFLWKFFIILLIHTHKDSPGFDVMKEIVPALVDLQQRATDLGLLGLVAGQHQLLTQLLQVALVLTEQVDFLHAVLCEHETHKMMTDVETLYYLSSKRTSSMMGQEDTKGSQSQEGLF